MKYILNVHLFHSLRIYLPDTFDREIQLAYLRQTLKSQKRYRSSVHYHLTSEPSCIVI